MAWVPPCPGISMGRAAVWVTRSTGTTTFCTPTPDGGTGGPVVVGAPRPEAGETTPPAAWPGPGTTPLLVTT